MAQGIRIAAVLDAFLEDQHREAPARAATSSEEIVSLLRHCLERYGYESLGRADRTRFETAFAQGDEEAFCKSPFALCAAGRRRPWTITQPLRGPRSIE